MKHIPILKLDHIGIRVTDLKLALDFYALFGFEIDPTEDLKEYQACVLWHPSGLRINLVCSAEDHQRHNILMDGATKYSGITHIAMVIENMQEIQKLLNEHEITVTEGPMQVSNRRIICFLRDPDGNVIELNQLI